MHELTRMIKDDMKPALGVTEPGAIAFAVAKAKSYTHGEIALVHVAMNSGMYKNAFTCGIPNSNEVGNVFSAALGAVAGDADKGLEALAGVTKADNDAACALVDAGKVTVSMSEITSRIFIEATVRTASEEAVVTVRDSHTHITDIVVNGETVFSAAAIAHDGGEGSADDGDAHPIHRYSLAQLLQYIETVDPAEIEFIREAYTVNMALLEEGLGSDRTVFARQLLQMNGGKIISDDERKTASLLCNAAIEARVLGLDKAAMSITGSGSHGIIAAMPLYAYYKIHGLPEDRLLRATALSYLVCMYVKEFSGKLSAFCGCAIAAGTGAACALAWLKGGDYDVIADVINNMASGITGMICDGGNQGCVMKGIVAVDAAFRAVDLALGGAAVSKVHGICGQTPELTMRNMGLIASPGMVGTEKTIVEIFEDKLK